MLLSGLVTGDDDGFSPERKNAFVQTGTTHLTAVSGSNLALVAGILATVGGATIGRHRTSWQFLTILGIWAYALVSVPIAIGKTAIVAAGGRRVPRRRTTRLRRRLVLLWRRDGSGAATADRVARISTLGYLPHLALVLFCEWSDGGSDFRLSFVLTATVAAQLATLPGAAATIWHRRPDERAGKHRRCTIGRDRYATRGPRRVARSFWPPLGEVIAAPAILAATVLIRSVGGALDTYVGIGVAAATSDRRSRPLS